MLRQYGYDLTRHYRWSVELQPPFNTQYTAPSTQHTSLNIQHPATSTVLDTLKLFNVWGPSRPNATIYVTDFFLEDGSWPYFPSIECWWCERRGKTIKISYSFWVTCIGKAQILLLARYKHLGALKTLFLRRFYACILILINVTFLFFLIQLIDNGLAFKNDIKE